MAYDLTFDERYAEGYFLNSSGYNHASNLLNKIFVISEGDTASYTITIIILTIEF